MTNNDIVQKLWNLCDVLRDDGINYSDYVTELVLLLFLKMIHENTENGILKQHPLPVGCRWTDLQNKPSTEILNDYKVILLCLSTGKDINNNLVNQDPLIKAIYTDAQTRLREPRHLEQIIEELNKIDWFSAKKDGLGDLYEGLLEKNASEIKSGAGQYFTPRALINSMVCCIKPQLGEIIQDPAAGTGGFIIAANSYIRNNNDQLSHLSAKEYEFQKTAAFVGIELVPSTRRLALMNCILHDMDGDEYGIIHSGNALGQAGANLPKADVIFANPPFGTAKGGEASIKRNDLTHKTSNKQLAFLQHIYCNLKPGGRAAVIVPDNVLFEAGVSTEVRRDLMNTCNLHTILRLPTGIFYAHGVKTNVLFFHKGSVENKNQKENCTSHVWIYDLRTNMPSFGKRNPFDQMHLKAFEEAFEILEKNHWAVHQKKTSLKNKAHAFLKQNKNLYTLGDFSFTDETIEKTEINSRLRCFNREHIRDMKADSLDIVWLKNSDSINPALLADPEILAIEAMTELTEALRKLDDLLHTFQADDPVFTQKNVLSELLDMIGQANE